MITWEKKIFFQERTYHFATYPSNPLDHFAATDFYTLNQQHTANWQSIDCYSASLPSDGLWALTASGAKLAIRTADCLPIAIIHRDWFANLHAGRKGLEEGLILQLQKQTPLSVQGTVKAIIGPHICKNHYEVDLQCAEHFAATQSPAIRSQCIQRQNDHYFLDLAQCAKMQLQELFSDIEIFSSAPCTFEHSFLHSFRRDKTAQRNFNVLSSMSE
jgi:polyphenol oxidase